MARDGLFFKSSGELNHRHVPAWGLIVQGIWAALLVLPRTINADGSFGSLYNDLLTYVISAALIFYILTIAGIIVLRQKRPNDERPYKAFGYPIIPVLYIIGAGVITVVLFIYQTATTWPGLIIVLTGIPVYFIWKKLGTPMPDEGSISEAAAEAKGEY
jgi:APA family basic amino acid/polyamine antiporter